VFLEWLYSRKDGHRIDDAVDPDGLDGGQVFALDLVLDVVHVTLVDQLFPEDLCLELFFLAVVEIF
jgi:hypothetical protein